MASSFPRLGITREPQGRELVYFLRCVAFLLNSSNLVELVVVADLTVVFTFKHSPSEDHTTLHLSGFRFFLVSPEELDIDFRGIFVSKAGKLDRPWGGSDEGAQREETRFLARRPNSDLVCGHKWHFCWRFRPRMKVTRDSLGRRTFLTEILVRPSGFGEWSKKPRNQDRDTDP